MAWGKRKGKQDKQVEVFTGTRLHTDPGRDLKRDPILSAGLSLELYMFLERGDAKHVQAKANELIGQLNGDDCVVKPLEVRASDKMQARLNSHFHIWLIAISRTIALQRPVKFTKGGGELKMELITGKNFEGLIAEVNKFCASHAVCHIEIREMPLPAMSADREWAVTVLHLI